MLRGAITELRVRLLPHGLDGLHVHVYYQYTIRLISSHAQYLNFFNYYQSFHSVCQQLCTPYNSMSFLTLDRT